MSIKKIEVNGEEHSIDYEGLENKPTNLVTTDGQEEITGQKTFRNKIVTSVMRSHDDPVMEPLHNKYGTIGSKDKAYMQLYSARTTTDSIRPLTPKSERTTMATIGYYGKEGSYDDAYIDNVFVKQIYFDNVSIDQIFAKTEAIPEKLSDLDNDLPIEAIKEVNSVDYITKLAGWNNGNDKAIYRANNFEGTPVPDSGLVEKIYLNTGMPHDEVIEICKKLNYIEYDGKIIYPILTNETMSTALCVIKTPLEGFLEGVEATYTIAYISESHQDGGFTCFNGIDYSHTNNEDLNDLISAFNEGWLIDDSFNGEIEFNTENALSMLAPMFNLTLINDELSNLFSIVPFESVNPKLYHIKNGKVYEIGAGSDSGSDSGSSSSTGGDIELPLVATATEIGSYNFTFDNNIPNGRYLLVLTHGGFMGSDAEPIHIEFTKTSWINNEGYQTNIILSTPAVAETPDGTLLMRINRSVSSESPNVLHIYCHDIYNNMTETSFAMTQFISVKIYKLPNYILNDNR